MLLIYRRDLGCAVLRGDAGEQPTRIRRRGHAWALNACILLALLGLVPLVVRSPGGEDGLGVTIPFFVLALIWGRQAYHHLLRLPGVEPRRAPDRRGFWFVLGWAVLMGVVISLLGRHMADATGEELRRVWATGGATTVASLAGLAWILGRLPRERD